MHFGFQHLKKIIILFLPLFGLFVIVISTMWMNRVDTAVEPLTYLVPAVILFIVGLGCVFFGLETYLLRDDPDIWR